MAGTKLGGLKAAATNKRLRGEDFYREIGRKGGSAFNLYPKGFAAMTPEERSLCGQKGGRRSKRGISHTTKKVKIGGIEMTQIIVRKVTTPAQKVRVNYGR